MPPKKADPKKGGAKGKADPKKSGKSSSGGGKAKKKKWSKGKVREKLNNMVMWDKATRDKLLADVPKYKVITTAVISDRLKVNGSMAREALRALAAEGLIKPVNVNAQCKIYTRGGAQD
eukprot:TRINITY_DN7144_c0_g1_i1.p1 TRINITY_DN7144_c0_g1~~TRINITY_DN7144_c0_g1_i1.p1  ORF type:complete len:119 (-),score=33.79 TRINITY_DN7144_c0_g1_i1:27-383(-)